MHALSATMKIKSVCLSQTMDIKIAKNWLLNDGEKAKEGALSADYTKQSLEQKIKIKNG